MKSDHPSSSKRRIRVALDPTAQSHALLQAAVNLAADMEAYLEGLLIEDINLLRMADLPFTRQISPHSTAEETVAGSRIERELKVQARKLEQMLAEAAAREKVEWTFRVIRGMLDREIMAAAAEADLLALWGAKRRIQTMAHPEIMPVRILRADRRSGATLEKPANIAQLTRKEGSGVLILSCQSPLIKEEVLREILRQAGVRVMIVS